MDIDDFLDNQPKSKTQQENNGIKTGESSLKEEIIADIEEIKTLLSEQNFDLAERKYVQAKEQFVELTRIHNNEHNRTYKHTRC